MNGAVERSAAPLLRAQQTFDELLNQDFETLLDVGSGDGCYAERFRREGKQVTTISLEEGGDYLYADLGTFDCLWVCHVLEHQRNVGAFLDKCFFDLKDGGILAVTVPKSKPELVGGHLTIWNAGLLLYNLILAGFDCSKAKVLQYGYHISVIVRKEKAKLPYLKMDFVDIETLERFFPFPVKHGDVI